MMIVSPTKGMTAYSVRIVCGLLFTLFCVLFLQVQSPILEMLQHVLSDGKTSYSPLWGTIVITLILLILQILLDYFSKPVIYFHAITYLPSFLLLAFITDKDQSIYTSETIGGWGWILIGVILFLAAFWWINRLWLPLLYTKVNSLNLTSYLWPNTLILVLLASLTLSLTNLDPAFHAEVTMENYIRDGEFQKAAEVEKRELKISSRELSYLRAYTLSREDTLGSCLFQYPQPYRSEGLLPLAAEQRTTFMQADELYSYLGGKPFHGESTLAYLARLCSTDAGAHPALDYYLCALLLEKELDLFVEKLEQLYELDESLPKHYQEALVLYQHRHNEYVISFEVEGVKAEFQQFYIHMDAYRTTYWYYFYH